MTRQEASQFCREELNRYGLQEWNIRLNADANSRFLGLCSYRDKTIILSTHHIDIHPTPDVKNTIKHEVAHAVVGPYHGHDDTWATKAREIGCDNTLPCSNLSLTPEVIDAIRSGATVEVTFEEQVIRTPKYNITRLQDKCDVCGKVAVMKSERIIESRDGISPDLKLITLECGHTLHRHIPKGTPFHTFQYGGDPECQHVWEKNKCIECGRSKPYDFQLEGMKFLEAGLAVNRGAACFDDMGLGKTIQAGGVIYFHPELTPTLWIVKSALKYQTSKFLVNWLGVAHVPQVVENSKSWLIPGLKHYIIGYDMLVPKSKTMKKSGKTVHSGFDIKQFEREDIGIKCVVLDECQQIKNVDSTRTQMVRRVVSGKKVIPLSGTPWNNRGSELFPVFNMMDPMRFNSEERFKRDWVDVYYHGNVQKEGGIKRIPQFKEYTKDLCIRRERQEVLKDLPLVNRTKLNVVMDLQQEREYDAAVEEFVKWFESQSAGISGMAIIAMMAKLRHLVALTKIPATLEYVDEFVEDTDRKIVIFAHHQDVQSMLFDDLKAKYENDWTDEDGVEHKGMPVLKFVAGMDAGLVHRTQATFNENKRAILVASQLAAGEGLNLQTCCDCVMHERQWNPGKEEQCEGRFPRPGTTATSISAVYTHMNGLTAIDNQLDAIVERKRRQYHKVMNKGEAQRWNEDEMMKELAESIVRAHRSKKRK